MNKEDYIEKLEKENKSAIKLIIFIGCNNNICCYNVY